MQVANDQPKALHTLLRAEELETSLSRDNCRAVDKILVFSEVRTTLSLPCTVTFYFQKSTCMYMQVHQCTPTALCPCSCKVGMKMCDLPVLTLCVQAPSPGWTSETVRSHPGLAVRICYCVRCASQTMLVAVPFFQDGSITLSAGRRTGASSGDVLSADSTGTDILL